MGGGKRDYLETTYKYITTYMSEIFKKKKTTGRSEEEPCGASGLPAWEPSLHRKHDFLPLVS